MASEPNVIELYIDPETNSILEYIPATGTLDSGDDLPEDAIFVVQINFDGPVFSFDSIHCHCDEEEIG